MTEDQEARSLAAAHAVQAGTKTLNPDFRPGEMDCRIGLNVSKAEMGGFAELLIAKGVITRDEYVEAMIKGCEDEKARMEDELSTKYGGNKFTLV